MLIPHRIGIRTLGRSLSPLDQREESLINRFEDREEHTPQEVRAGLTEYMKLGYVAADLHSESGSRTLDYSCKSAIFLTEWCDRADR
jgi:putative alpha-1,2-mannosidase